MGDQCAPGPLGFSIWVHRKHLCNHVKICFFCFRVISTQVKINCRKTRKPTEVEKRV